MSAHLSPEAAYKRVSDQQKLAAEPEASAWVSANAGSGKTKVLIDRVARLLLAGADPDCILCITYTKAAASEMQQRLFKRLGTWSVMGDEDLARDLSALQNSETGQYDTEALKTARALFAKALETPGGLRIETLHAFAGRVLKRFPLEAGIPPGFTELDEADAGRLWDQAGRTAFLALFENPASKADLRTVIRHIGGLGLKEARKLIQDKSSQISAFLSHVRDPQAIRAMLSKALGAPDVDEAAYLSDFMSSGLPRADILNAIDLFRAEGGKQNLSRADHLFSVLEEPDPQAAFESYLTFFLTDKGEVRKALYTKKLVGTHVDQLFNPLGGSELVRLQQGISHLSAIRLRDRTAALLTIARPLLDAYTSEKRRVAGLDFSDLILETRRLLTEPGQAEWVLYKLDGGISHVLLDEAQDTSPDQWTIVNALINEFFAGSSVSETVRTQFVVGDEKQSIYSFQGADTEKFQQERQRFASRQANGVEGARLHLPEIEMSFRTTPDILEFVDTVFNTLADSGHPTFTTETPTAADRIRHHPFRHDQTGRVEFWPVEKPEKAETGVPWDAPLDMEREVSAPRQLSQKIAKWIRSRLSSSEGLWSEDRPARARPVQPGDVLILVRSRGPLFNALIQELKAEGLPVAGADRVHLLETLVVQDLLNLIRFVLCPGDDLTLAEILKGPFAGLLDDDRFLFPIAYGRKGQSLWDSLQNSDTGSHRSAVQFLRNLLAHRHLPAFEFLDYVLQTRHEGPGLTGWQMIDRRFGMPSKDPVDALVGIAGSMEDDRSACLQTFLAAVETQDGVIKRELSGPSGEIRVMTVHGAKGLESPIVILPDTTSLPKDRLTGALSFTDAGVPVWLAGPKAECDAAGAIRAREKARQMAEQLRLLYVGLTRARDELIVCGAWSGQVNGSGFVSGSWYDICQRALPEFEGRAKVCPDTGHFVFGRLPALDGRASPEPEVQERPVLPDWMSRPVIPVRSRREQRAPSQLLPGDTPVLPPFGQQHVKRFQRGRLIHALLEILPDLPEAERADRADRYLALCLSANESDLAADIRETALRVLTDPVLSEVFGPGGRAEAPVVGRGPNLPEGLIINGRIDRMRITQNEVWIIDYKTDRPPPKTVGQVALPYLAQMAAYFDVLSHTYPDKSVKCALLWTDGPHFMVLPQAAMLEALTKARAGV